jgi:H+/gluconate symporter-like permease
MIDPLAILLIGILTVIVMIVGLRLNAFVGLIIAATVVSLLSIGQAGTGELAERIARVASAFGEAAGSIGIVIALASVIGKCLSDSGASDRIVRAFLRLLGEKRAATALLSSGFVLGVPVFFDTVFYLLVPLARSLYRRTHKNYVLYILAIAAGAVITHTLVPPTPGPLIMAENLGIDLGVMIIAGALIGLPMAVAGLLASQIMNRLMNIPMRPYSGDTELAPLKDAELPPLWLSLLPVVLPVVLISANTAAKVWADAEHRALFQAEDVTDWFGLQSRLLAAKDDPAAGVDGWAWRALPEDARKVLAARTPSSGPADPQVEAQRIAALNGLVRDRRFYQEDAYVGIDIPAEARKLIRRGRDKLSQAEIERLNRILLERAFAPSIRPHAWTTARRQVADVTALLGNANLALLLSAAVALVTLKFKRRLSLKELAQSQEVALMSGGVIILITAAGGAFGIVLKEAGIKDSIQGLLGHSGSTTGLMMLVAGYAVATMMKIAQGSGTVSMLTTSAMMAAMGVSSEMLGFHPVYLAAAIGCGSMTGSWMNDSGFWIFSRMSGLTETETLRSWTLLLVIIGLSGLITTMICATLLPMV